jgi:hypothetical protein
MMNHRRGSIQPFGEAACQQLFARLLTKGEPFCLRLIVLDEVQRVSAHVAMLHLGKMLLTSPMDAMLTLHKSIDSAIRTAAPFSFETCWSFALLRPLGLEGRFWLTGFPIPGFRR